jgi:hypothetical protein
MAPQITELLPNPNGSGNDATDEYIELYNPNSVVFDLSGFTLESGLTTLHNYTFPDGSSLPPHGFKAYYASSTKLTLSNTSGQVKLLDPLGNSIAATEVYGTATDGQTWALANGVWYWTTQPTPEAPNVIKQPLTKITKARAAGTASKTKTAIKPTAAAKKLKSPPTGSKSLNQDTAQPVPIHPWELALVGGLALLYGVYEYRKDLANYLRQCRTKLGASGSYWQKAAWWRGGRTGE